MSKFILCPECGENIFMNINNYKIFLNCKNAHKINYVLFDEYEALANKGDVKIDYACNKHNKQYNKYCNNCKINICELCDIEHSKHKIINYNDIIFNINDIINQKNELRKSIDEFNKDAKEIKETNKEHNNILKNLEIYFNLFDEIINNFNKKNINYQTIQNLIEYKKYNQVIIQDLTDIINCKDVNSKMNKIMEIYLKMNPIDELTIIYKKSNNDNEEGENENNIRILGDEFVKNNKNHCKIIYQGKELELKSILDIDSNTKDE